MDGFVMTEADAREALAERQSSTRAMLAEGDYSAYLESQAEQLAGDDLPLTVPCGKCDRGRIVTEGFDGRTGRECGDCHGAGEIVLTPDEAAIVGRFHVACRIAVACGECGHHRDLHDDGECPPIGLVVLFPMRATLPPAA